MKNVLEIEVDAYGKKHNDEEVFGFVDGFNKASTIILYATGINTSNLIVNNDSNIEKYLIENGFKLHTYYGTNKRYMLEISDIQILYVRIYSDSNEIVDVEYENNMITKYDTYSIISFDTINSLQKLQSLIFSLT